MFGPVALWADTRTTGPLPPLPPRRIDNAVLEAHRISGEPIEPDAATRQELAAIGSLPSIAVYRLCIDTTGAVSTVNQIRSSGLPAYDATIEAKLRARTYQPFLVGDERQPVCANALFVYPPAEHLHP